MEHLDIAQNQLSSVSLWIFGFISIFSTIVLVPLAIFKKFNKGKDTRFIFGFFTISFPLLDFILFQSSVAKYMLLINLSIFAVMLIWILLKTCISKNGYEIFPNSKILKTHISQIGAIFCLIFFGIIIIQFIASICLWIDIAWLSNVIIGYAFIALLLFGLVISIFKFLKFLRPWSEMLVAAFFFPLMFSTPLILLGINNTFTYYYSPMHEKIYIKDSIDFTAHDRQKAKMIAERLKNGEIARDIIKSL